MTLRPLLLAGAVLVAPAVLVHDDVDGVRPLSMDALIRHLEAKAALWG